MTFEISRQRLHEIEIAETEANCDIEAGFDWGQRAENYLSATGDYVDRQKLVSMLREELGGLLAPEAIESIATDLQSRTKLLVIEKLQAAAKSA